MNKEKEMYMIIESLSDRIESVTGRDVCSEDRKEYHISMMRLETKRLLELLGVDADEAEMETIRENLKKVATQAAGVVFDTLRESPERGLGLFKVIQSLQSPRKRKNK